MFFADEHRYRDRNYYQSPVVEDPEDKELGDASSAFGSPNTDTSIPNELENRIKPGIMDYLTQEREEEKPTSITTPAPESRPTEIWPLQNKNWADRRIDSLQKRKQNIAKKRLEQAAARKAANTAIAAGASAVAGVATGGVSLVVEAGLFILQNEWVQKILLGFMLLMIVIGLMFLTVALGLFGSGFGNGPDPFGARFNRPLDDTFAAAVGAHAPGAIVNDSIQAQDFGVAEATKLLANPPKGANVAEAKRILQEIHDLKTKIRANTFASRAQNEAQILKEYQEKVEALFDAIYPGRPAAKQRVQALIGSRIALQSGGSCNPTRDLKSSQLSQYLLNVILSAAQHTPITINCIVTGHRKYVGHPPPRYPRCGDPQVLHDGARPSYHCLGRAVDFSPNRELQNYLTANKGALNIRSIKDEGNHLHVEVSQ